MNSEANFHDGFVDGLLLYGKKAHVFLRTVKGEKFTLILHDVDALRVNDFLEGNIIFSVEFMEPNQLDESFIFDAYQYSEEYKKSFVLATWIAKATEKHLKAAESSPSYGCELLAVYKEHQLVNGYRID
jgi:hypothetical protein